MSPRLEHKLLGDIGATNARFALLAEGVLGPVEWLEVAQYASFTDAVGTFLNQHCQRLRITDALLAVAGPVEDGRCALCSVAVSHPPPAASTVSAGRPHGEIA